MKRTAQELHQQEESEETRALKRRHEEQMAMMQRTFSDTLSAVVANMSGGGGGGGATSQTRAGHEMEALEKRNRELEEELENANRMFLNLSMINSTIKTELNEAKEALVKAAVKDDDLADVLPIRVFCEADDDEVEAALKKDGRGRYRSQLDKVCKEVDDTIRDASFDPFHRAQGKVTGVKDDHPVLLALKDKYGAAVAALVVEKKREIETYCPSGSYPTPVLFVGDKEMRVGEAVERLLKALKKARAQVKRPRACRAEAGGGDMPTAASGSTAGSSSTSRGSSSSSSRRGSSSSSSSAARAAETSFLSPHVIVSRSIPRPPDRSSDTGGGGGGASLGLGVPKLDDEKRGTGKLHAPPSQTLPPPSFASGGGGGAGGRSDPTHALLSQGGGGGGGGLGLSGLALPSSVGAMPAMPMTGAAGALGVMTPAFQEAFISWLTQRRNLDLGSARSYCANVDSTIRVAAATRNHSGAGWLGDAASGVIFARDWGGVVAQLLQGWRSPGHQAAWTSFLAYVQEASPTPSSSRLKPEFMAAFVMWMERAPRNVAAHPAGRYSFCVDKLMSSLPFNGPPLGDKASAQTFVKAHEKAAARQVQGDAESYVAWQHFVAYVTKESSKPKEKERATAPPPPPQQQQQPSKERVTAPLQQHPNKERATAAAPQQPQRDKATAPPQQMPSKERAAASQAALSAAASAAAAAAKKQDSRPLAEAITSEFCDWLELRHDMATKEARAVCEWLEKLLVLARRRGSSQGGVGQVKNKASGRALVKQCAGDMAKHINELSSSAAFPAWCFWVSFCGVESRAMIDEAVASDFCKWLGKAKAMSPEDAHKHCENVAGMIATITTATNKPLAKPVQDKAEGRVFCKDWNGVIVQYLNRGNVEDLADWHYWIDYVNRSNFKGRGMRTPAGKMALSVKLREAYTDWLETSCGLAGTAARGHGSNVDKMLLAVMSVSYAAGLDGAATKVEDKTGAQAFVKEHRTALSYYVRGETDACVVAWLYFVRFLDTPDAQGEKEEEGGGGKEAPAPAPEEASLLPPVPTPSLAEQRILSRKFLGEFADWLRSAQWLKADGLAGNLQLPRERARVLAGGLDALLARTTLGHRQRSNETIVLETKADGVAFVKTWGKAVAKRIAKRSNECTWGLWVAFVNGRGDAVQPAHTSIMTKRLLEEFAESLEDTLDVEWPRALACAGRVATLMAKLCGGRRPNKMLNSRADGRAFVKEFWGERGTAVARHMRKAGPECPWGLWDDFVHDRKQKDKLQVLSFVTVSEPGVSEEPDGNVRTAACSEDDVGGLSEELAAKFFTYVLGGNEMLVNNPKTFCNALNSLMCSLSSGGTVETKAEGRAFVAKHDAAVAEKARPGAQQKAWRYFAGFVQNKKRKAIT